MTAEAALFRLSWGTSAPATATRIAAITATTAELDRAAVSGRLNKGSDVVQTVLVTGGTGFIAGWCIIELLQRGYAVRTTIRCPSKEPAVRAAIASAGASGDRLSLFAADLSKDEGWDAAMRGCDYVLHIASPLTDGSLRDPYTLVAPERDGTLRVLRTASKAGIKRVVLTSAAAAARIPVSRANGETVWADATDPRFNAYRLSRILAERAAWDFMTAYGGSTTLTAILPGAVFGPVLTRERPGSAHLIQRLLEGRIVTLPRLGFWIVDVRDLADLHISAMTSPAAAGERFAAAGDFMWMSDIAATLRARLGKHGKKIPTRALPELLARSVALLIPPLRGLTPELGRRNSLSVEKARRLLRFSPRPAATTLVDCAESLVAG